jgi:hypothetical protein
MVWRLGGGTGGGAGELWYFSHRCLYDSATIPLRSRLSPVHDLTSDSLQMHFIVYHLLLGLSSCRFSKTIQVIQPTRYKSFTSLLLDVYVWLNMFRESPRPTSGAYNCTRSLWLNRWGEAPGALLVVVCLHTTNNAKAASFQR